MKEVTMIVVRTPFRVSFFGGGTDYPRWYQENDGHVISTSIDKYSYVILRQLPPFFPFKNRIRYFSEENTQTIEQITHPIVRESARFLSIPEGFELVHTADLPARSGLGSSSAFTVGLLHAFRHLKGDEPAKQELAEQAIYVEQELVGEAVGSQDQIAAAFGGFNSIRFKRDSFQIESLREAPGYQEGLADHLMLCFTGFTRTASDVASQQIARTNENFEMLKKIAEIAEEAYRFLRSSGSDYVHFGELLNEQWHLKKQLGPGVSKPEIDQVYDTALRHGAWGGKLLGAGGGGFMVFIAPPESHDSIKVALSHHLFVPFSFDFEGSKIVYNS